MFSNILTHRSLVLCFWRVLVMCIVPLRTLQALGNCKPLPRQMSQNYYNFLYPELVKILLKNWIRVVIRIPDQQKNLIVCFYQNISILDFIGAKGDGGGDDNLSYKTCKAPVKSSPQLNNTQLFTDWMPCQSTEGKNITLHGPWQIKTFSTKVFQLLCGPFQALRLLQLRVVQAAGVLIRDCRCVIHLHARFTYIASRKRMLVLMLLLSGGGNSAFEIAQQIYGSTNLVHMVSRSRVRLSWSTHYVGDLRSITESRRCGRCVVFCQRN